MNSYFEKKLPEVYIRNQPHSEIVIKEFVRNTFLVHL